MTLVSHYKHMRGGARGEREDTRRPVHSEQKAWLCKLIFIPNLAFEFEVPGPLRFPGAGDTAGLLQGLVEPCDVLLHLLQWGQHRLGLPQQRQASLSDLIGREGHNRGII